MKLARLPRRANQVVLYALLALVGATSVVPLLWLVRSAFMGSVQILQVPPTWIPDPLVTTNFSGALTEGNFGEYFFNTLTLVVVIVPGTLLSCSFAAFAFSRVKWPGRDIVFGVLMTGMMLPYAVTLIPTFLGWERLGFVDTYVPLALPAWFGAGGAFYIFLLRQFFLSIPKEYDEAVYMDGGSPFTVYRKVVLPLSSGPLTLVAVFSTLSVWNDLLNPLLYINSPSRYTLSLGLAAFTGQYTSQWGLLMAGSLISIIPVLVIFAFAQRRLIQGIEATGLKG